jgi:hypothetical protein
MMVCVAMFEDNFTAHGLISVKGKINIRSSNNA